MELCCPANRAAEQEAEKDGWSLVKSSAALWYWLSVLDNTAMIGPFPGVHRLQFGQLLNMTSSPRSSLSVRSTTRATGWLQPVELAAVLLGRNSAETISSPVDFCRADSTFVPAILLLQKLFIITREQTNNPSLRNYRRRASRLRC